ncbi:hypothetical protein [Streptomyces sp. NPDC048636]|uniref:hypothetical protein n=1 Tax=Streptomyces sp. NPDC048636 TaxID=3155762 RepID=UPI00344A0A15
MSTSRSDGLRTVTVTMPTLKTVGHATTRAAGGAAHAAMMPFNVARRVLPAKGGLPLYAGLGALGAVEVLEWPVAVGIGVGYAVLRRGGAMAPPSGTRKATA